MTRRWNYVVAFALNLLQLTLIQFPWIFTPLHFGFRLDWSAEPVHTTVLTLSLLGVIATALLDWLPERQASRPAGLKSAIPFVAVSALSALVAATSVVRELLIILLWILIAADLIRTDRRAQRLPWAGSAVLVGLVLAYGLVLTPTPYALRSPSSYYQMDAITTVQGGKPTGHVISLTVGAKNNASLAQYLVARIYPDLEVYREAPSVPSVAEQITSNAVLRDSHDRVAMAVAQQYLGLGEGARPSGQGVRVYAVSKGSPADTKLQIGDVITGIDGTPVGSLEAMRQIMSTVRAGVPLTLAIRRGEKPLEVQVAPAPSNTNPNGVVLGISLEDLWSYDIPVSVKVGAANVVGPSWSGVLTLEIIDQLTPGGVLHGNTVAGTGSVEPDGSVSKIGGLR
ncbi:MAG TPA: PDZ domain-containing protein, partial [Symbiobacteriaceae bacterium]|nr:PDZ domain-containing protein [Symbiobacteriaceae bacterium]